VYTQEEYRNKALLKYTKRKQKAAIKILVSKQQAKHYIF